MDTVIQPEVKNGTAAPLPDFRTLFEQLPGSYLVLLPDAPAFTIVAVSDAYLTMAATTRRDILGCGIFEVLPGDLSGGTDDLVIDLRSSLERAIATGAADRLLLQNYGTCGRTASRQERYRSMLNTPVFAKNGSLQYVLHCVDDVRKQVRAEERQSLEQRDAFLVRLDDAIRPLAEPDEIRQTASKLLGDYLQADRCVFCTFEPDQETFNVKCDHTRSGIQSMVGRHTLAQFGPAAGELFRANLPYVVADVEVDPCTSDHQAAFHQVQIRAHASVPLLKAGRLVAVMGLHQQVPRQWLAEELDLLQLAGSRCWEYVERVRVVRELRNSEERLRLAQRASKSGTFEWLIKEGRVIWTPELEALYGMQEGTFEGSLEDWRKRVVAQDVEQVMAGIADGVSSQKSEFDYEFRAVMPDQTKRWLRGHAQCFYNEAGQPVRMVGTNIDIEAYKQAEAGVRQQRHTFDTALSNTPDFTYIFDLEGRFTYVNRALLFLLNLKLEDALGKNFFDLDYPGELAARLQNQIRQTIDTKAPVRDETPFAGPSGETRYYEYIFVPVLAGDGRVEAVAGSTRDVTDRSKAGELVEQDRQRWRELLLQAPAAIAVLHGPDHRFEWVNTDYVRFIGRPAEALLKKTVLESLPEIEGQVYVELLNRVYRTGVPFVGHESLVRVDKGHGALEHLYVNFVYAPTKNSRGEIDGIFVHATDVTEIVEARKQVEESEKRFRTLVESAKDHAIIGLDLEGLVASWNTGAERLLGFKEAEILGQSAALTFTPEDREANAPENELATARDRGKAGDERWHLRKDGTRFWGSATLTPFVDEDGAMLGYVKVFQDRTREWAAQEALRESEERFRQLANSMPQMVWTARPDGSVDYFNERWYEYTGLDRSPGNEQSWNFQVHPEDQQRCYEGWCGSLRSGEPYQMEYRFWDLRENRWRWFIVHARPVRDNAGQIVKWFGSCTDIDEQKTAQTAVLQAQKLECIGLLAGGVAHDFNNLLVGIMGGASFAMDSLTQSHPAYGMLQDVVDASEKAAHLTRQMLAYAGKGRFIIEPVDLSEMVDATAELVTASIPKSVRLELKLDQHLPTVQTDAGQMQQVAMNLIINAAEAVGENRNGLVTVRTQAEEIAPESRRRDISGNSLPPGTYAVLEVRDTGCGIDSVTLTKIFDPFFTTKFTGRGLGLAAVLGIVRSHQGAIEVETAPSQGSTFRILLPATHTAAAKISTPALREAVKGRETILVIDDEAAVRRVAKAALEGVGFTALVVAGGEQGLEHIRRNKDISLVLLDMSMPEMSGRQVLEALKLIRPELPVMICSGYSEDEVYRQFSGLDLAGVLQKPFTTARLAAKVRSVLDSIPRIGIRKN